MMDLWVNPFTIQKEQDTSFWKKDEVILQQKSASKKAASKKSVQYVPKNQITLIWRCMWKKCIKTVNHIYCASCSEQRNARCINRRGRAGPLLIKIYLQEEDKASCFSLSGSFHKWGWGQLHILSNSYRKKNHFQWLVMAVSESRFPCKNDLWARGYTPFCSHEDWLHGPQLEVIQISV